MRRASWILFLLVIVIVVFADQTYTVTRERVNIWFDGDIASFNDPIIFIEKVQQPIIERDRLDKWFVAYTEGEY